MTRRKSGDYKARAEEELPDHGEVDPPVLLWATPVGPSLPKALSLHMP